MFHLLVCSLTPHPNFAMNLLVLFCTYCSEENEPMIDQAYYCNLNYNVKQ